MGFGFGESTGGLSGAMSAPVNASPDFWDRVQIAWGFGGTTSPSGQVYSKEQMDANAEKAYQTQAGLSQLGSAFQDVGGGPISALPRPGAGVGLGVMGQGGQAGIQSLIDSIQQGGGGYR